MAGGVHIPVPDLEFDPGLVTGDALCFEALTDLAARPEKRVGMWMDPGTRQSLLDGAAVGAVTQTAALIILSCLSVEAKNRLAMWTDASARSVLIAACDSTELIDHESGMCPAFFALQAISNLAWQGNRKVMWEDSTLRQALRAAANAPVIEVRRQALRALANLAEEKSIMKAM
ncbi:unnamed protein product [Polarella glacialis]|uniref:Protein HGH1 homolog n=1 Tax=Polarella glacialis TaxID=89957 RepID=A0A813FRI7_POLGL|nr:unnamed protein product [Polarella glacialis]CAE8743431.1 unnamed protein product [Polarella glacialis]